MKKTVLYEKHLSLKAKIAPFGGYEMPVQYEGIIKEHNAARTGTVIFDTCHMGEFKISGDSAVSDLERILSCDVADIKTDACRYGFLCNGNGGVIDDQILYRISESEFMMVVNASTEEGDFEWIKSQISENTKVENISAQTAKIDLQGPLSPKIAALILQDSITELKFYNFAYNYYKDTRVLVSRTGYTGEMGFEIYSPAETASLLWDDCISKGAVPAGIGARDTLRLEIGFPLYGHELSIDRNAIQSGFNRAISQKKVFIGSSAVFAPSADNQILVGITLDGRRSAREGDMVLNKSGQEAGIITSASFSPTLGYAIALGYVNKEYSQPETLLKIISGKNEFSGKVSRLPFYKNATARSDIKLMIGMS
ncbi:MAG: glycine cleavage system aminomethyltransferase GcvT [Chitinispirillales bacterium]|jgi:aminomethyltransferase|nr:glycine cleavage system aminomethyltransferase GcvT [Chitinispirillales bacterium]